MAKEKYKENWKEAKEHFKAWWNRSKMDRPILRVIARRKVPIEELESIEPPKTLGENCITIKDYIKSDSIKERYRKNRIY